MVIADRYELVERLGRGGMGEVWQARDLSLNVDVAVMTCLDFVADLAKRGPSR